MYTLKGTHSNSPDFTALADELDSELLVRYDEIQREYSRFDVLNGLQTAVVAYWGDIPVGCGCFKEFRQGVAEIKRVFVKPKYRNKGIATHILAELEKWAATLGYATCILETGDRQPESVGLYKKTGYTVIENYREYAGKEHSICMQKVLPQPAV